MGAIEDLIRSYVEAAEADGLTREEMEAELNEAVDVAVFRAVLDVVHPCEVLGR